MSDLSRFSVSLEADLLEAFDVYVRDGEFATRSEAIRQLLRQTLARDAFEGDDRPVTATLTIVYDHHRPHLVEKLLELQHQYPGQVVASMHVHLDHDRCMEVIVLKGPGGELRHLAASLRGLKGVHMGDLALAGPIEPEHNHPHDHHPDDHGHSHNK
ncbi:MAG: nickel-responsive transcriptional regulator NikR [Planctomycetaceae bacterium]|nr:nickel-responsive transcriptional regulator NikR [Planctomycetaceae bacterium]